MTRMDSVIASNRARAPCHLVGTSSNPNSSVTPTADSIPHWKQKFYISYSRMQPRGFRENLFHARRSDEPGIRCWFRRRRAQDYCEKTADADGDTLTTRDQAAKRCISHCTHQACLSPISLPKRTRAILTVSGLQSGVILRQKRIAVSWHRINGNQTLQDTSLCLSPGDDNNFINFKPNSLTVSSLRDNDGNLPPSAIVVQNNGT